MFCLGDKNICHARQLLHSNYEYIPKWQYVMSEAYWVMVLPCTSWRGLGSFIVLTTCCGVTLKQCVLPSNLLLFHLCIQCLPLSQGGREDLLLCCRGIRGHVKVGQLYILLCVWQFLNGVTVVWHIWLSCNCHTTPFPVQMDAGTEEGLRVVAQVHGLAQVFCVVFWTCTADCVGTPLLQAMHTDWYFY